MQVLNALCLLGSGVVEFFFYYFFFLPFVFWLTNQVSETSSGRLTHRLRPLVVGELVTEQKKSLERREPGSFLFSFCLSVLLPVCQGYIPPSSEWTFLMLSHTWMVSHTWESHQGFEINS